MSPSDSPNHAEATGRSAVGKRLLVAILKAVLLGVVFYFVGRSLVQQFAKLTWDDLHFAPVPMVLAVAVMIAANAVTFLYYRLLLVRFGHAPPWRSMMAIVWVAQVAKYVPGKIGSVVGIAAMLKPHGVPRRVTVSTVVINDGLSIVLGLLAAVLLSLWQPVRERLPVVVWVGCAALAIAGCVCLHPRVFRAVGGWVLRRFGHETFPISPRVRDYLPSLAAMLGHFCLLGLSYWLAARAMTDVSISLLPLFVVVAITVSIAGFIAFFAPAGIGVQEGLLLVILIPLIGATDATILAVLMRVMRTATEALLALAGLGILRLEPANRHCRPGDGADGP